MESREIKCERQRPRLQISRLFAKSVGGLYQNGNTSSSRTNRSSQRTDDDKSNSHNSGRAVKLVRNESTEIASSLENQSQGTKQCNDKPYHKLDSNKSKNSIITNSNNESCDRLENAHLKTDSYKRKDLENSKSSSEDECVHIDLDKKHERKFTKVTKVKLSTITFANDKYKNVENEPDHKDVENKPVHKNLENKPVHKNAKNEPVHKGVENKPVHENVENKPIHENLTGSFKKELSKISENKSLCERQHSSLSCSNELSEKKSFSSISSEKTVSNTYDLRKNSSFNCRYSTDESSKKKTVSNISGVSHERKESFDKVNGPRESGEDKSKFTDPNVMPAIEEVSSSTPISCTPAVSVPQEKSYGLYDSELPDSKNKELLLSSAKDFIPPPVSPEALNISAASYLERGDAQHQSESNSDISHSEDEACSPLPDSEHLNEISAFINGIMTERKVSVSSIDNVVRDLNALFKENFEGNLIDIYGSYAMDLAITTSNMNLVIKSDVSVKKSFMSEVYKLLANELEIYRVHPLEEGFSAHETKISFSDPKTGINCELAYLGRKRGQSIAKMEKYLKTVCDFDDRVRPLIIAAKVWAEYLSINEVEDGKLHPISFSLLVIHFLQHCENPLLPISSTSVGVVVSPPSRDISIGELWMTFLRYYAVTFNWKRDVVTVDTEDVVTKKSKEWETYWIAIEDPFSGKNVAASVVNCDIADYITACFKYSYEYFCNPVATDRCFNEGNEVPSSPKLQFNFQNCVMGQDEAYCEACEEMDDTCAECKKKLYIQPITPMPKMTNEFLQIIKKALHTVYEEYMLSDEEVTERKQFVKSLERTIHRIHPDAQLDLFGSSANGFGFKRSDLDICISFQANKAINPVAVLKDVRTLLRKDKRFGHIIAIFNATIPIIKFHFEPKGWRGDISLNNTLAVHNSELLYTYSLVDERCKILGSALKLLAKKALVAEVTEKALSSYSYLIMVIHFLQQTEPPVLPVLQDNQYRKTDYKLKYIVENCNIWFCKDLDYIKSVFKSENETPVEQLWLDLLDYYCSLDHNKYITIRQKEMLHVNENHHSARLFNIQDPFIETKNLGVVVSVKKAEETKSVFNRARHLFRTPKKELPSGVKDIEDYFFSSMSLTGRMQKEAYCEMCGKFGHEKKDCKQCYYLPPKYGRFRYNNPFRNGNFKTYQQLNNKQPMTRAYKPWTSNAQYVTTRTHKPRTSN